MNYTVNYAIHRHGRSILSISCHLTSSLPTFSVIVAESCTDIILSVFSVSIRRDHGDKCPSHRLQLVYNVYGAGVLLSHIGLHFIFNVVCNVDGTPFAMELLSLSKRGVVFFSSIDRPPL